MQKNGMLPSVEAIVNKNAAFRAQLMLPSVDAVVIHKKAAHLLPGSSPICSPRCPPERFEGRPREIQDDTWLRGVGQRRHGLPINELSAMAARAASPGAATPGAPLADAVTNGLAGSQSPRGSYAPYTAMLRTTGTGRPQTAMPPTSHQFGHGVMPTWVPRPLNATGAGIARLLVDGDTPMAHTPRASALLRLLGPLSAIDPPPQPTERLCVLQELRRLLSDSVGSTRLASAELQSRQTLPLDSLGQGTNDGLGSLARRIEELAISEEGMIAAGRQERAMAGVRHQLPVLVLQLVNGAPPVMCGMRDLGR